MKYSNFFFNIVAKNIKFKKIFIKDKKFEYKYFHIKNFFFSLIKKFGNQKRQIKICTLSEKSFFLYSSILSIILSRNIYTY